jgi:4-hydroxybenzoate polyprenyltransferase
MAAVLAILSAYAGAAYLAAQAFQAAEDRERGYRTLVATHGPRVVLAAARACLWAATGGLALLAMLGWFPRACVVVLGPAWICDRFLVAWRAEAGGGDAGWAQGFARRLMLLGAVLFVAAYADYGFDLLRGTQQVAGLGTAAGRPR